MLRLLLLAHCVAAFNVAVFMPFHESQKQLLLSNVASWKDIPPCAAHTNVDLIIYSSTGDHAELLAETRSLVRKCFRNITHVNAGIPADYDTYEAGAPITQLFGMFDHDYLRLPVYDYVMLMEPDTRPVRPLWLDQLLEEIDVSHPFYVKGSGPRYATNEEPHINGNAIYSYANLDWLRFLCGSFGAHKAYGSFDMSIHAHIMETRRWDILTKYVYTDFIHNNPPVDNLIEYVEDHPRTYLIHNKKVVHLLSELYPNEYTLKAVVKPPKHGATRYEIPPTGANICRRLNFPQGATKVRGRHLPVLGGVPLAPAPADLKMLLWSAPKPTAPGTALYKRQVNAVKSWCLLNADVKLVLCNGYDEFPRDLQWINNLRSEAGCGEIISSCKARKDGMPYLNAMISTIDAIAKPKDVIVFVNGDCITMPNFEQVVREAAFKMKPTYLIAGSRIGIAGNINVGERAWEHALQAQYHGTGSPQAIDVFAYHRHAFGHMPGFIHASFAWDNWMLAQANVPAVDMTDAGGVVWHQDHAPNRNSTKVDRNFNTKLALKHGGWKGGSLNELPYYMTVCRLEKPTSNDLVKEEMGIVQKKVRRFSGNPTLCLFKR